MWSITALKNLKCREFNSPLRKIIFFFVQVNYYKLFIYACILFNDKKQSKVMSNLSKITLNLEYITLHVWTLWTLLKYLVKSRARVRFGYLFSVCWIVIQLQTLLQCCAVIWAESCSCCCMVNNFFFCYAVAVL